MERDATFWEKCAHAAGRSTHDARWNTYAPFRFELRPVANRDRAMEEDIRSIRERVGRRRTPQIVRAGVCVLLTFYLALIVISVVMARMHGVWWMPLIMVLSGGSVFLASLTVFRGPGVIGSKAVAAEMLRVGRCPQCAYVIRGVRPEDDGCVVCPECAAAWRKPDADVPRTSG